MPDLQTRFAQAQQDVNDLAERPDNDTVLKLYALYKQATQGDATGERPSSFDFVRRANSMLGGRSRAPLGMIQCGSTST
jgi:diazepam-binding inhibitor (GABA receptor modulator, acyl-CoA-binding protein)